MKRRIINLRSLMQLLFLALFSSFLFLLFSYPLRKDLDKYPCQVCGKPARAKKETFYEYRKGPIPRARIYTFWYCPEHYDQAPLTTKKPPLKNDTILHRLLQNFVLLNFASFSVGITVLILELPFTLSLILPLYILIAFLLFGITHPFVANLLLGGIFLLPGIIFFIWWKINR